MSIPEEYLIINPTAPDVDIVTWGKEHQAYLIETIKKHGAVVFSGFNITKETFSLAFEAVTGEAPRGYISDTPRDEVITNVFKSTAVSDAHLIPLHQEGSATDRALMPQFISFFCTTPPKEGTGRTVVGNVREVTRKIQEMMPNFWNAMATKTLTYTCRYAPQDSWLTRWIQWLNPSFSSIERRFGTSDWDKIQEKCAEEGLECKKDGSWVVVTRRGVPATIDVNGEKLFCNQIHVDKLNPQLVGGIFYYLFARIFMCPTESFMQFDVEFDDGTTITPQHAGFLLECIQQCYTGRDWKAGDMMVLNNVTTMHGKTPHQGPRDIVVAMGGSL